MAGNQIIKQVCNDTQSVFIPFVEFGYPSIEVSMQAIRALANLGATIIEVGVPSPNPHLDGEIIERANRVAIKNGANLRRCIEAIKQLRAEGIKTPIMLMSYQDVFPTEKFQDIAKSCRKSGINGFLIPDLSADSKKLYKSICRTNHLSLTDFITAAHTENEIRAIMQQADGFIYAISTTGKTGAGSQRAKNLPKMVKNIRKHGNLPIALGFGMSTVQHVKEFSSVADGIIVGSALVEKLNSSLKKAVSHAEDMQITLIQES